MTTHLWAVGLVLLATTIGAWGPLFFKKASDRLAFNLRSILTNYYFLIAIMFYGMSTVLFIPALKGGELSVLYPCVALVYVWVSLISVFFLKEKMNSLKWVGIALILTGVTLIGLGSVA